MSLINLLSTSKDFISSFITIIVVPVLLAYFIKKSENFATKRDIRGLTEQEEAIKNLYMERYEIFDADLKYKYELRNDQYKFLYSRLYSLICASESARYCSSCYGQSLRYVPFEETPIFNIPLSMGEDGIILYTNNATDTNENDTLIDFIIQLVDKHTFLASAQLIKIISLLKEIRTCKEQISEDVYSNVRKGLRRQLVVTILQDCENIKRDLKFEANLPTDSLRIKETEFFSDTF